MIPEEEAKMVEEHIREHHVDLRMGEEMESIHAGEDGRVSHIITKNGEQIDCQIVGLTAGVSPNVDWLKDHASLEIDRGILVDHFFQTNLPHVWSVGDCAQFRDPLPGRRPLEQVWYTGKMQATFLAEGLRGERKPYSPGIWWNSAKFFDIEYQTYGMVMPQPQEGEETFFWKAPNAYVTVRINYRADSLAVTGCNVFGVRHRHQVWEHWIETGATVTEVIGNLAAANFDPEFFKQYEPDIIHAWNAQNPNDQVSLNEKKGLFGKILTNLNLKIAK